MQPISRAYWAPQSIKQLLEVELRDHLATTSPVSEAAIREAIGVALRVCDPMDVPAPREINAEEVLLDFNVLGADGSVGRPWVTVVRDAVSDAVLAFRVGLDRATYGDVAGMLQGQVLARRHADVVDPRRADPRLTTVIA